MCWVLFWNLATLADNPCLHFVLSVLLTDKLLLLFFLLLDHDEALAQAIQEATAMNPDMTVEKIEIHQTNQQE